MSKNHATLVRLRGWAEMPSTASKSQDEDSAFTAQDFTARNQRLDTILITLQRFSNLVVEHPRRIKSQDMPKLKYGLDEALDRLHALSPPAYLNYIKKFLALNSTRPNQAELKMRVSKHFFGSYQDCLDRLAEVVFHERGHNELNSIVSFLNHTMALGLHKTLRNPHYNLSENCQQILSTARRAQLAMLLTTRRQR